MINPKLYKNSRVYDFFMKSLGYESGIDRFLRSLTLDCPSDCRILDAGCGTGLLGLHFLNRFADGQLVATDLEPNFLRATLSNADKRGIDPKRIRAGVADISEPSKITSLDGDQTELQPASFDLICVGAVVGYASDTESTIRQLIDLLAPNGYLMNLEMNESLTGRFVSHRYHYRNISLWRMQEIMREQGCDVSASKLSLRHLPAKFTRSSLLARKPAS
ncbi:MAG: class I SAM-dependent methyltransferase [Pirellulaceae bacterium]|nr:class I SAM-dependent methyltransferase [Pirellulaceae bacterium]